MFSKNDTTREITRWNDNKDDIIKAMKAINLREKGNSVFSLVLDEIRGFGDDINMDLMMHLLHQGPSTRSLSCGEWEACTEAGNSQKNSSEMNFMKQNQ